MRNLATLLVLAVVAGACSSNGSDDADGDAPDADGGSGGSGASGGDAGSGGSASSGGDAGGSGGTGGGASRLGAECVASDDCNGLACLFADAFDAVFRGGISNGYCSAACLSDADCTAIDDGAVCVKAANAAETDEGRCLQGCIQGGGGAIYDPLDERKCHGRLDVGCAQLTSGATVCLPRCGDDSDCPAPFVCGIRSGFCRDTPSQGLPIGTPCDPDGPNPCAGQCVGFSITPPDGIATRGGVCSHGCVQGSAATSNQCFGTENGVCGLGATATQGPGDFAFCLPPCTTHEDCPSDDGMYCNTLGLITEEQGYCFTPDTCTTEGRTCRIVSQTCTDTPFGLRCFDRSRGPVPPLPTSDAGSDAAPPDSDAAPPDSDGSASPTDAGMAMPDAAAD